ncbi:M48 family metallopeptidase [Shimia ponticola]|uniref:M48 family metallopeptidase n=1 Tax=Shimia ponticola TaxID=2582893 RepID=UPI0011BF0756|nr:M48 family metallopeptidase [Shimia ponticola]
MTVIRIGAAPESFQGKGLYFDGDSALPVPVELTMDERRRGLMIVGEGRDPVIWPLDDIRALGDQADPAVMTLRQTADPMARLVLSTDEERRIMQARAGNLRKSPPVERKGRLLAWSLGAVASVALMVTVLIPLLADSLAEYLPPAGERALGDATLGQIRTFLDETRMNPLPFCESEEGSVALAKMGETLFPDGIGEQELRVYVLEHEMVNAFALPGGIIVLFEGLIEEAETPDEVASVYAHEVGHVVARDPTRIALRSAGSIGVLGLLFGDFAGGALILFLTERIIQADYSQEAEAAADAYAHSTLANAGYDPAAMADFFERLRDEYGDTTGWIQRFMAHPNFSDRIAAARAATPDTVSPDPILSQAEWRALRSICDDTAQRSG